LWIIHILILGNAQSSPFSALQYYRNVTTNDDVIYAK